MRRFLNLDRRLRIHDISQHVTAGFNDVVRTTVFLVDISDFSKMNEAYTHYFGEAKPARSTVSVAALPRGARVQLDAIAARAAP